MLCGTPYSVNFNSVGLADEAETGTNQLFTLLNSPV
jgi:hypothetical protein